MMIVECYEFDESLQAKPVDAERIVAACMDTARTTRLDVEAASPQELDEWLDQPGLTGLTRQLCRDANDRPGFYPLRTDIIAVFPLLVESKPRFVVDYISVVCRENLLITLHAKPTTILQLTEALASTGDWLTEVSVAALVSAMMFDLSQLNLQHTVELRTALIAMDQRMDRDPDAVSPEETGDRRTEQLTLDALVSDQLPLMEALAATDKSFFQLNTAGEYLSCALANLRAAASTLSWADRQIGAIRSGVELHAQEKTNRRLNMLTILSAIFMPITLLASIWGMNFQDMPELRMPFGYGFALGAMFLVGLGMYLYFRRTGWLDSG